MKKNIRLTNKNLKKLVKEALSSLKEADTPPKPVSKPLNDDSIDVKIDAFLVAAESNEDESMEESVNRFVKVLLEDDSPETPEAPPPEQKKLNVHVFARESARLIDNFENLVDVKGILLRRCLNFVKKNYDDSTVKQVEDILSQDFSISQKSNLDKEDDVIAPTADRAGPNVT